MTEYAARPELPAPARISTVAGSVLSAGGTSSVASAKMETRAALMSSISMRLGLPSAAGAFQMRRSSSCAGRGSRSKSHAHTPKARTSQSTMAKRNLGSIQPGPSHTRPTSRIKKKRGPKLKARRVRVPGSGDARAEAIGGTSRAGSRRSGTRVLLVGHFDRSQYFGDYRSEEHTSELQSRGHLVCRLLLEKKK